MLALREDARTALAGVVHVEPTNVALTASTTEGCNIVVAGLELGPDDEVVTTDSEHFGLLGPLQASRRACGSRASATGRPEDALDAILSPRSAEDAADRALARLVADREPAADRGAPGATGLPMLVDGAQSGRRDPGRGGSLRLLHDLGAKVADGAGLDRRALRPRPGGAPRRPGRPTSPSSGTTKRARYTPREGAARFDGGWFPAASLAGLIAAIGLVPHWAFTTRRDLRALLRPARERFKVVTAPGQANLVVFAPGDDPAGVAARLYEAGVVVRDMPNTPVGARLLRLVDERRRPRPAPGAPSESPSRTRTRDTGAEGPGRLPPIYLS